MEEVKKQIQVGDRVTYIETQVIIGKYKGYGFGFDTKEVKNKTTEIVINNNKEFKRVLKVERIGTNGWYTVYEKKADILDKKEKEYLKSVIKPFKNKIEYIKKTRKYFNDVEYVCIVLEKK